MCFKQNKKIDIEKGRRIFFEYKGNSWGIHRDYGPEYTQCNIPNEMEEKWRKEIADEESKKIQETN